ncbi:MAG: lipopolysaccharide assembly protein LapA domain-containing protein [Rhizobium sp.]
MVKKFVNLVILVPLGIVLIVLSVANRQSVTLALNPFRPEDQLLAVNAPFFVFLFLSLMLGVVIGGLAMWFAQGKYRKRARNESRAALKWQVEADKQKTRAEEIAGQGLPQLQSK